MSFFQNIINSLFGTEEEKKEKGLLEYGDELKHNDPDYKFAKVFTRSGGIFNYCADESEALGILKNFIEIEGISSVFCFDEDLKNFLDIIKTPYTTCLEKNNDAVFITCEYLIAYDGSIMLSHNNILHFNSQHLPEKIIVMANVSQIVENSSKAMMQINRRKEITKNLTSISGSESQLDSSNKKNKKIFLLLLED